MRSRACGCGSGTATTPTRRGTPEERCDGSDVDCDGAVDERPAAALCGGVGGEARCALGRCEIVACEAGRADCDGAAENGCEVTLGDDVLHCGVCGHRCGPAPECAAGVCEGFRAIGAGEQHVCAIRTPSGRVACWGAPTGRHLQPRDFRLDRLDMNEVLDADLEPLRGFVQIAAGSQHTCALHDDGSVWCWGSSHAGQTGSVGGASIPPTVVPGLADPSHDACGIDPTTVSVRSLYRTYVRSKMAGPGRRSACDPGYPVPFAPSHSAEACFRHRGLLFAEPTPMAESHIVLLGTSDAPAALRRFAAAEDAFEALDEAAGLVIDLPFQNYAVLVALARKRTPPTQVLVLSDEPSATRRELRRLGLTAEVLARPVEDSAWGEILRRFGLDPRGSK